MGNCTTVTNMFRFLLLHLYCGINIYLRNIHQSDRSYIISASFNISYISIFSPTPTRFLLVCLSLFSSFTNCPKSFQIIKSIIHVCFNVCLFLLIIRSIIRCVYNIKSSDTHTHRHTHIHTRIYIYIHFTSLAFAISH